MARLKLGFEVYIDVSSRPAYAATVEQHQCVQPATPTFNHTLPVVIARISLAEFDFFWSGLILPLITSESGSRTGRARESEASKQSRERSCWSVTSGIRSEGDVDSAKHSNFSFNILLRRLELAELAIASTKVPKD